MFFRLNGIEGYYFIKIAEVLWPCIPFNVIPQIENALYFRIPLTKYPDYGRMEREQINNKTDVIMFIQRREYYVGQVFVFFAKPTFIPRCALVKGIILKGPVFNKRHRSPAVSQFFLK
jgi:hypothetical protein